MITRVIKRDGRETSYNIEKIANAIYKALEASEESNARHAGISRNILSMDLASRVAEYLDLTAESVPHIEEIQDMVERVLMECRLSGDRETLYPVPRRTHHGPRNEHPPDEDLP